MLKHFLCQICDETMVYTAIMSNMLRLVLAVYLWIIVESICLYTEHKPIALGSGQAFYLDLER